MIWIPIEKHNGEMWLLLKGEGMDMYEAYKYKGHLPSWAKWYFPIEYIQHEPPVTQKAFC